MRVRVSVLLCSLFVLGALFQASAEVTINTTSADGTLSVWSITGIPLGYINVEGQARRLILADPTASGTQDAYVATSNGLFRVFSEGGILSKTQLYSGGSWSLAAGDVNNNGHMDIVLGGAGPLLKFEYNGSSWSQSTVWNTGQNITGVTIGDSNGNGTNEIGAFFSPPSTMNSAYYEWNGSGFGRTLLWVNRNWQHAKGAVDVNGDGVVDSIAVGNSSIYRYDYASGIRETLIITNGLDNRSLAIGNVDGNWTRDVVVVSSDGSILNYQYNGESWWQTPIPDGRDGLTFADICFVPPSESAGASSQTLQPETAAGNRRAWLYLPK